MRTYGRVWDEYGNPTWVVVGEQLPPVPFIANNTSFGTGNGSRLTFLLAGPSGQVAQSASPTAIYRTDWQGQQLLYTTGRTNYLQYSNMPSSANWGIGPNATLAVATNQDGSATAAKLTTVTAGAGNDYFTLNSAVPVAAGTVYSSIDFINSGSTGYASVIFGCQGSNGYALVFNPSTGAIVTYTSSGSNYINGAVSIVPLPTSGWFRIYEHHTTVTLPATPNQTVEPSVFGAGITYANPYCSLVPGSYFATGSATSLTVTDYSLTGTLVYLSQAPVSGATLSWSGSGNYPPVPVAQSALDDAVWLTTLAQCLKLNLGESPFFANYGIPQYQSVMTQVFPDFYVLQTQAQFSGYFASLLIAKVPGIAPNYNITAVTRSGQVLSAEIPV